MQLSIPSLPSFGCVALAVCHNVNAHLWGVAICSEVSVGAMG